MTERPYCFEDLMAGMSTVLPSFTITKEMRDKHIELYGEDWPAARLDKILKEGVIPSPMVISIIGGLMGKENWFNIKFLRGYDAKFLEPIKVGDTITTVSEITDLLEHKDTSRDYGFVTVKQDLFNQAGRVAYQRNVRYAICKRGLSIII